MLATFLRRNSEIGLRRALGASRRAIFAQLLTEAGVIGLAGGALGLVFALLGLWVVRQQPTRYAELAHLDPLMLITTFVLAISASVLAGLLPAWRACQVEPGLQMKSQEGEPLRGRAPAATGPVRWLRRRPLNEPQADGSQTARFVSDLRKDKKSDNQARPWIPAVAWVQMLLFRMGITQIRPILSALRRHKTTAALIVLGIALSCAILINTVFLIVGRIEHLQRPSGLAEQEIVRVQLAGIGKNDSAAALTREDLTALRALPGVRAASTANTVVFGGRNMTSKVDLVLKQPQPNLKSVAVYLGGEDLLETLGVRLVAGRHFTPDEFIEWEALDANSQLGIPAAIITRSMADKLFPGHNPLGKSFHAWEDQLIQVVGIVDRLVQPNAHSDPATYQYSMIFPVHVPYTLYGNYLLRVKDPAQRAQVLKTAADTLKRNGPRRVILAQDTLEQMRSEHYQRDRAMAWLLVAICVALLVVTALGIAGLASFWVQQRTRQIGIRRALGATRGQILRYFQIENLLLTTAGIVLGMVLAYGLNGLLMRYYELPRLPIVYLPVGAIALWVLGQLAVLGPALRAASVSPAAATRNI